jgi:hypothetical protein
MRNAMRVAAENAPGVKRVTDNLRVASRPDRKDKDTEHAQMAAQRDHPIARR